MVNCCEAIPFENNNTEKDIISCTTKLQKEHSFGNKNKMKLEKCIKRFKIVHIHIELIISLKCAKKIYYILNYVVYR